MINYCSCRGCSRQAENPFCGISDYKLISDSCQDKMRFLTPDMQSLAFSGAELNDAIITTSNNHALMSSVGRYAPAQFSGERWQQSEDRVDLRINKTKPTAMVFIGTDKLSKTPNNLFIFDQAGDVQHRIEMMHLEEALALKSYSTELTTPKFEKEHYPEKVVPLDSYRRALRGWDSGRAWHFDNLLKQRGQHRCRILPYVGHAKARRVALDVIPALLAFLQREKVPFCRTVVAESLLQSDSDPVSETALKDSMVRLKSVRNSLFMLNLKDIAQCWHTRFTDGPEGLSLLELYSTSGECIAVFSPERHHPPLYWNELMISLPPGAS